MLSYQGHGLLVDTGPDLRIQALREGLREMDAVLYTHAHLDHVVGFDELRAFCWRREDPLPLYASRETMAVLKRMFGWAFELDQKGKGYVRPEAREVAGPFEVGGLRVTPLPVEHGHIDTLGFRFDGVGMRSVAYVPDVKVIPESTLALLSGVDVLVLDALRPTEHPTHFSLSEALDVMEAVAPQEGWLTHLGHENDHESLEARLPRGVHVAWDGLCLRL
jgi:phosphoribosyl 1,2-cyclic phosphate phosphodiesterase